MKHLNTNGLETTLEKVARTLSDKFGVNVVFQGDLCCTNGRTIFLPSLDERELKGRFRLAPLDHTVYKRFDESFTRVSGRMECMSSKSITPLGESMLFAARHLIQRPEERKVLFVMTDGKPVAGLSPEEITFEHAERAIVRIEKAGIDVALVGIMEECVTRLHHRSVVVPALDQLPRTVMNQLRNLLTKPYSA